MNGHHVACRGAHRLGSDHQHCGQSQVGSHAELELAEHHVGYGVGTGQESAQRTDCRGKQWIDTAHVIGDEVRQGNRHARQVSAIDPRVDQNAYHGHGEQQHEAGAEQHATGFTGRPGKFTQAHAMDEEGRQHHRHQHATRQVQRIQAGIDSRLAENTGEVECHPFQRSGHFGKDPTDHQQNAHQHIGNPGPQAAHRPAAEILGPHLEGAHPAQRPVLAIRELPDVLRYQKAGPGCQGHHRQAHQPAQQ